MGQNHLYQQTSQPAKGNRLGTMGRAVGDLQLIEAEVVRDHKQKMHDDVDTSSLIINETGLTCGHLKYMHTDKEVQAEEEYMANSHPFSGKSAKQGVHLKYLYTINACNTWNKIGGIKRSM